MHPVFIAEEDFRLFVAALLAAGPVYGPVARRSKFVFDRLQAPDELRLDHDVTILPPKKLFFPPTQHLIRFDGDQFRMLVAPEPQILLGVHPYDVRAIDITDQLFAERHYDVNYMAYREVTTIVAASPERVGPRAFWGSMGTAVEPSGHDALLTRIAGGYLYEARTARGEALLANGRSSNASEAQVAEAALARDIVRAQCPERWTHPFDLVATHVRAAFTDERLWDDLAADCFSCGSCNIVCPTCYCFDVQDWWEVNQQSGARTRYWDACLTEDFATISLGAKSQENFRDTRGERFRHRIMRKAVYLNGKLGGPACVGCGRCAAACTADIADPVAVIDRLMASKER